MIKKTKQAYIPKGKMSWATKLSSEFLGTIFLSWMIGILGVTFGGLKLESILSGGMTHNVSHLVIGCWVALDVFIVLAIFSRWSCDLNPTVTIYRILNKQNSGKYGAIKILTQILGGLVGGLCIWSTQEISHLVSHIDADMTIRTIEDAKKAWVTMPNNIEQINHIYDVTKYKNHLDIINNWENMKELPNFNITKEFRELQPWSAFTNEMDIAKISNNEVWDNFIGFLGEFLGVFILLWPIMTKQIKSNAVKDMVLLLVIVFGVSALLELGTVAWNPARLLATNYIYDTLKPGVHAMRIFPSYLAGELLAPIALFYGQKATKQINKKWEQWLSLGKIKDTKK